MKKLSILLIIFISFLLVSCWKTKFEELPQEQQKEIQEKITSDLIWPYMQEIIALAFSNMWKSESEVDKIIEEKAQTFKNDLTKYLNDNYPDIEFNMEEMSKIDNSRLEDNKEKVFNSVKYWEFFEIINEDDSEKKIKLKVNDIVWKWKEYTESNLFEYKAKNEFLFIRLEAENIWKKADFISFYDVKLITSDWYEFEKFETLQRPENLKEWYEWCIECEMNPLSKAEQYIIFDIPKLDLTWAKLRFEDRLVDFEL